MEAYFTGISIETDAVQSAIGQAGDTMVNMVDVYGLLCLQGYGGDEAADE